MQCGAEFCTLNHILTGCSKALAEGRYKWRHDKVLREVAKWTDLQRMKANSQNPITSGFINFRKAGEKHKRVKTAKNPFSILGRAADWELQVDLKKRLVFPQDVVVTALRPDMILMSKKPKHHCF